MGVCFGKWKFVFENRSLKMEVCFRKSELKIRICCRKSGFDVGACSARVAWALVPDCAQGSMFRHWRNGGQCWSNDDKKTTFLNLTQNQVKDLQETLCKRRKKRRKTERGTTCPPLTKNTNHRSSKEIRTRKIIKQSEEALKALNRHSQRGTCPKTLQYKARADEVFKTDINKIRETTEQELVNVLIRYHERRTAEYRRTLKGQKRPILN